MGFKTKRGLWELKVVPIFARTDLTFLQKNSPDPIQHKSKVPKQFNRSQMIVVVVLFVVGVILCDGFRGFRGLVRPLTKSVLRDALEADPGDRKSTVIFKSSSTLIFLYFRCESCSFAQRQASWGRNNF